MRLKVKPCSACVKPYKLSEAHLNEVATSYPGDATVRKNAADQPELVLSNVKFKTVEEETEAYYYFFDKAGRLYAGAPAIPLPFVCKQEGSNLVVTPVDCTPEYGKTCMRGQTDLKLNLLRLSFQALDYAMHYTNEEVQTIHPLEEQPCQ